jgi:hypothetical protein
VVELPNESATNEAGTAGDEDFIVELHVR